MKKITITMSMANFTALGFALAEFVNVRAPEINPDSHPSLKSSIISAKLMLEIMNRNIGLKSKFSEEMPNNIKKAIAQFEDRLGFYFEINEE